MTRLNWPPPPHDPRERVLVEYLGDWEIRIFSPTGTFHRYFAAKGMLHVQLWHPGARLSLLTPSPITAGRFEVYPLAGWKHARYGYHELAQEVRSGCGVELPRFDRVFGLMRMFAPPPAQLELVAK